MSKEELFNCSTNRAFSKIQKFWESYGERFPLYFQKYFKANIFEMIDNNNLDGVDEISKSIFNYLGLLSMNADMESQFLSFFEQYFKASDLYSKRIVSATQNYVPTIEKKITDEIYKGHHCGRIKTFGPNIITKDPRINPELKSFSPYELSDDDQMIISFAPRDNAERILSSAVSKEKELLLNFDGFVSDSSTLFASRKKDFVNKLSNYAKSNKSSEFDVDVVNYSIEGNQALVLKRK